MSKKPAELQAFSYGMLFPDMCRENTVKEMAKFKKQIDFLCRDDILEILTVLYVIRKRQTKRGSPWRLRKGW